MLHSWFLHPFFLFRFVFLFLRLSMTDFLSPKAITKWPFFGIHTCISCCFLKYNMPWSEHPFLKACQESVFLPIITTAVNDITIFLKNPNLLHIFVWISNKLSDNQMQLSSLFYHHQNQISRNLTDFPIAILITNVRTETQTQV